MNTRTDFEQMGIAAMIPGLQHAIEIMQAQLDSFRERLRMLQSGEMPQPKMGRPRKILQLGEPQTKKPKQPGLNAHGKPLKGGPSSYWAKLTPEERSAEVMRRRAVSKGLTPSGAVTTEGQRQARLRGSRISSVELAKKLGITLTALSRRVDRRKMKPAKENVGGKHMNTFTPEQVAILSAVEARPRPNGAA